MKHNKYIYIYVQLLYIVHFTSHTLLLVLRFELIFLEMSCLKNIVNLPTNEYLNLVGQYKITLTLLIPEELNNFEYTAVIFLPLF